MTRLCVEHIAKSYDGVPAIRDMSFKVDAGRILALCGENGAGKSTLMKILSGALAQDSGQILLDGEALAQGGPAQRMALGIQTVYQELSLLPHLSVAENMFLGRMPARFLPWVIDWQAANRMAATVLHDFGFDDIDPCMLVRDLSVSRQQVVEIAKALVLKPRILILDEPTAVLSALETDLLFSKMQALARDGATILYISHRMEEIFRIADDVVVLKDGVSVLAGVTKNMQPATLIEAMVGRPLEKIFPPHDFARETCVLDVQHLSAKNLFHDISFRVHAGEILGLFGLVGSGRTEIAKAIFGATPADGGDIRLNGRTSTFKSPMDAVSHGIALITEDRKGDGLALDASVLDNAALASMGRMAQWGIISSGKRQSLVDQKLDALSIRPRGSQRPVRQLSGGNQQKVVLAKWLLVENISLYIFDEPTRGVDIATKVEIYRMIAALAEKGAAILLISSEMPEVIGLSDRMLILREGRIVAELKAAQFTMETLFMQAAGLAGAKMQAGVTQTGEHLH